MPGPEFFGQFESEHDFSRELYQDGARRLLLERLGFTQDMAGNRRSLYTSADIVEQLTAAPDSHPFKQLPEQNRWGPVLHRGGDTTVGGFQEGKNLFQIELIDEWIARAKLQPNEPGFLTERSLTYALDELHRFGDDLATGKIKVDGRPLGVLGADAQPFRTAWANRPGAIDPSLLNDLTN